MQTRGGWENSKAAGYAQDRGFWVQFEKEKKKHAGVSFFKTSNSTRLSDLSYFDSLKNSRVFPNRTRNRAITYCTINTPFAVNYQINTPFAVNYQKIWYYRWPQTRCRKNTFILFNQHSPAWTRNRLHRRAFIPPTHNHYRVRAPLEKLNSRSIQGKIWQLSMSI